MSPPVLQVTNSRLQQADLDCHSTDTASQHWDAQSQNGVSLPVNHFLKTMKIKESKHFTPMIFAFFIQPAKALTRGVFQMSFPISLDKGFPPGLCFALLQAPHGSTAFPLLPGTAFKRCLSAQALTDSFTSSSQTVPSAPEILQESQTRDALGAFDQESLSHSQVLLMQMSSCTRSLPQLLRAAETTRTSPWTHLGCQAVLKAQRAGPASPGSPPSLAGAGQGTEL